MKEENKDVVTDMFALRKEDWHSKKKKNDTRSSKEPKDPANYVVNKKREGAFYHWLEEETADVIAELREEQAEQQKPQADEEYELHEGYESLEDEVELVSSNEEDDWVKLALSQPPSSLRSPSTQRGTLFYPQIEGEKINERYSSTLTV